METNCKKSVRSTRAYTFGVKFVTALDTRLGQVSWFAELYGLSKKQVEVHSKFWLTLLPIPYTRKSFGWKSFVRIQCVLSRWWNNCKLRNSWIVSKWIKVRAILTFDDYKYEIIEALQVASNIKITDSDLTLLGSPLTECAVSSCIGKESWYVSLIILSIDKSSYRFVFIKKLFGCHKMMYLFRSTPLYGIMSPR